MNLEAYNDQDTVARFASGDTSAFRIIFDRYFRRLSFFAASIIGDSTDADDIAQEALYQLWVHRSGFTRETQLKSWLYISARNAGLNYLKSHKRREERHLENSRIYSREDDFMEAAVAKEELLEMLLRELEEIPPQHSVILKLLFLEGLGYQQIAERLGIPETTVRKQKERAVKLLRSSILKKRMIFVLPLLSIFQK